MSNRWYGSIDNRLAEMCVYTEPVKVGTLCTELCYSDRHPYEVIEVKDDRHITVRRLSYKVTSGSCHDGSAEYQYFSNENNSTTTLFKNKSGKWVEKIKYSDGTTHITGTHFAIGYAEEYYDPCF